MLRDLFKQAALLNHIGNRLHLNAFCFVDVFKGVQVASLLMLDDPNLDG